MHNILLIHGFGADRRQYRPIVRYLRRHGFSQFYEFEYRKKFGQVPIAHLAQQLDDYVRQNIREPHVDCIAISQGGMIARYFIQRHNPRLIRCCITLCTPHHGTLAAHLLPWKGLMDLRPGSPLLRQLNQTADATPYYCVWTPFDLMVIPGWSARLPQAAKNLRVWSLAHPLAFRSRAALRFIAACLTAEKLPR
ncbi:MAG: alpha/beta fold hydrolase [Patescibacteria group bacterium]|nr:alpha/beta fold hydrolase [Patescibacteria group bacterium]